MMPEQVCCGCFTHSAPRSAGVTREKQRLHASCAFANAGLYYAFVSSISVLLLLFWLFGRFLFLLIFSDRSSVGAVARWTFREWWQCAICGLGSYMGDGCIFFCSAQEEQGERVLLRASVAFAILALFLFDSRLGSRMADESKVNVLDGVEAAMRFREEEERKKKEEDVKARSSASAGEQEDPLTVFLMSGVPWSLADKGPLVKEVLEIFRNNGIAVRDYIKTRGRS